MNLDKEKLKLEIASLHNLGNSVMMLRRAKNDLLNLIEIDEDCDPDFKRESQKAITRQTETIKGIEEGLKDIPSGKKSLILSRIELLKDSIEKYRTSIETALDYGQFEKATQDMKLLNEVLTEKAALEWVLK